MTDLQVAGNYLESCQTWQALIDTQDGIDAKKAAADEAIQSLLGQTFQGDRNVIVSGDVALHVPDGTGGLDEQLWPVMQYGKTITRGWLGRLNCLSLRADEAFLAWAIYCPSVIGPVHEAELSADDDTSDDTEDFVLRLPLDRELNRTLHFPVSLINYAISYGR